VTHLRQQMLEELQRRNYSQSTVRSYIHAVEDFARYFHRSPERLGAEHIRQYQAYLFRERKLSPGTIEGRTAALRFLFVKTLRRPYLPDHIPFPKRQRRLPTILDQQEVARLIDAASNLMHRTMLMMLYATGLRRAELSHLKVSDIDSERMVIHVRQGKGGRDRDVLLSSLPDAPFTALSVDSEHPLFVAYTSGTTGRPKGAVHVHAGFTVKVAEEVAFQTDLRPGERLFWLTDIGWIMRIDGRAFTARSSARRT